jgi:DNA-binding NarL/FixJ family response regulator
MPLQILLLSKQPQILQTLLGVVNKNENWQAHGCSCPNDAVKLCASLQPQLVILGNGLTPKEETEFTMAVKSNQPNTKIIQHYGGGSGLLLTEIMQAVS